MKGYPYHRAISRPQDSSNISDGEGIYDCRVRAYTDNTNMSIVTAGSLGAAELLNISLAISLPVFFIAAPVLGTAGFFLGKRQSKAK
jgi:hypothetical protein